jgi:hypothetical protein
LRRRPGKPLTASGAAGTNEHDGGCYGQEEAEEQKVVDTAKDSPGKQQAKPKRQDCKPSAIRSAKHSNSEAEAHRRSFVRPNVRGNAARVGRQRKAGLRECTGYLNPALRCLP